MPHSSQIGSNIKNDEHYDQIAFFPGTVPDAVNSGIFDFDGALFSYLWDTRPDNDHADFFAYMRYYISDHRIMWLELPI